MNQALKIGIGLGGAAAVSTAWITSDRGMNAGAAGGSVMPLALGSAGATSLAVAGAARKGWLWQGSPAAAARAGASVTPLLLTAVGAAAGLGIALLVDIVAPTADGADPSRATQQDIDRRRRELAARNDAKERGVVAEAEQGLLDAEDQLDESLEPFDGAMGRSGTVGAGRLDVTGMSPAQATEAVFDAYEPYADRIERTDARVDGANVFHPDRFVPSTGRSRTAMTEFFTEYVDTEEPKNLITRDEARAWQAGPYGEMRTTGVEGVDDDAVPEPPPTESEPGGR